MFELRRFGLLPSEALDPKDKPLLKCVYFTAYAWSKAKETTAITFIATSKTRGEFISSLPPQFYFEIEGFPN